jgi:uncharacterized membrane protein
MFHRERTLREKLQRHEQVIVVHQDSEHRSVQQNRLLIVLLMTGTFMVIEVAGGLVTGNLALLADAGHMLTDVAALATVVGVLVEVPVMLSVCSACNRTRHWFPAQAAEQATG